MLHTVLVLIHYVLYNNISRYLALNTLYCRTTHTVYFQGERALGGRRGEGFQFRLKAIPILSFNTKGENQFEREELICWLVLIQSEGAM